MTNAVELKPCPFCGGEVTFGLRKDDFENTRWAVECVSCQAEMGWLVDAQPWGEDLAHKKDETFAAWNRRSVNSNPELVKALGAAKVVIGMMERPDGLGADVSSALDQRVAQIDAALSLAKGEGK